MAAAATLAVWAYPTLLGAAYAVYRVGRRRAVAPDDRLEWARTACLALVVGFAFGLQARLAMAGALVTPLQRWSAALSVASLAMLAGLNAYERLDQWRAAPAGAGLTAG